MAAKPDENSISARIREAREMAQLEPAELREELRRYGIELSKGGLHRLETQEPRNPNVKQIEAIADITNVSPAWILFGEGTTIPEQQVGSAIRNRVLDTIELMGGALDMNKKQETSFQSWLSSMRKSKPAKISKP